MTVTYKLVRIEANQPEKTVELSLGELDMLYLGLEEYSGLIDWSDDNEVTAELSGLMSKLGDI